MQKAVMAREVLYLSRTDVETLGISIKEVINVVEYAFKEKGQDRVEVPPKPGIHPRKDAFIHAMPAYIEGMKAGGMKWVSGYPENYLQNLPYINGLAILNDPETGIPVSIMDATWITAARTGAATAVAAKKLARKDSRTFGILGCGVQGRANLEALDASFENLREVRAFDTSPSALASYVKDAAKKYALRASAAESPQAAVAKCDIVVTAGPILAHPLPVIEPDWLAEGGFACALDFDSYWKPSAMHGMDKFFTDDIAQIEYYRTIGYFQDIPEISGDLADVLLGKKPGRENEGERIMSMNLGLAIEDIATAKLIYDKAKKENKGNWLKL
jgi:ornithine cyclodeaminase/alanine dehydrogenase